MSFNILGIGTATPPGVMAQARTAEVGRGISCDTPDQVRTLNAIYHRSGIAQRHSVLLNPDNPDVPQTFYEPRQGAGDHGPSTATRMAAYRAHALPMACTAAEDALKQSKVAPSAITHVITVSCTGLAAPGLDIGLIERMELPRGTRRLHIGFMGCHGALNALQAAHSIVSAEPAARVLLCAVELCSLHFFYGWDQEKVVANALFADGAAAVVAGGGNESGRPALVACGTHLFRDSADAMTWHIGDHGFDMTLSTQVPGLLEEHLRGWICEWLANHGLDINDVPSWAVHPGGPRILSAVANALQLDAVATDDSREVLRQFGNMSSPTVLFILQRMLQRGAPRPIVALAFGPGLVAEAALIR